MYATSSSSRSGPRMASPTSWLGVSGRAPGEEGQPDLVAGDLGDATGADGLLHPVRELRQRVLVDGAPLTGTAYATHHLLAAERLGDPAPLHHREHRLLDGG